MADLVIWSLVLYIPVFFVVMFVVIKQFKDYKLEHFSISQLGTQKSRYGRLFNLATLVMGILICLLGTVAQKYLGALTVIAQLSTVLISVVGVLTVGIAMVRHDLFPSLHNTFAALSWATVIALCITLSMHIFSDSLLPRYLLIIIGAILGCLFMMAAYIVRSYFMQKIHKSTWLWEWEYFFLNCLCCLPFVLD